MAFTSKIGNLLKQTVNKHIKTELSSSNLSLFQAIRCMSSSKLFIGGVFLVYFLLQYLVLCL